MALESGCVVSLDPMNASLRSTARASPKSASAHTRRTAACGAMARGGVGTLVEGTETKRHREDFRGVAIMFVD
jgi:hypothetical protein